MAGALEPPVGADCGENGEFLVAAPDDPDEDWGENGDAEGVDDAPGFAGVAPAAPGVFESGL